MATIDDDGAWTAIKSGAQLVLTLKRYGDGANGPSGSRPIRQDHDAGACGAAR
jgi:hypothetical protein